MTFTSIKSSNPRSLFFSKKESKISLIVNGQGTLLFANDGNALPCRLTLYDAEGLNGISIELSMLSVTVKMLPDNTILDDPSNIKGLCDSNGAYYWLSLDAQNQRIKVGLGEARLETVIYQYQFISNTHDQYTKIKAFLENIVFIQISDQSPSIVPLKLLRDPVTTSTPLVVKGTESLTLDNIARGTVLPQSSLSASAKRLHECIAGKGFVLDDNSFPDFSKAIEYSIATPGKWCYETLKAKASEFDKENPNVKETYLRITLGQNSGESPGVPYVMEIWPVGHYSPVHNHGGANAIIRVLHGSIQVRLFPFLSKDVAPFATAEFVKDDITWISQSHNQVHQLTNIITNTETCITIQCYMYDDNDTEHYDYFDYLDGAGKTQQFDPDSDMEFIAFKEKMREEWDNRPNNILTKSFINMKRMIFRPVRI